MRGATDHSSAAVVNAGARRRQGRARDGERPGSRNREPFPGGRPGRALGQLAPAQAGIRPQEINLAEYRIRRKQVLGGLTYEYQIAA